MNPAMSHTVAGRKEIITTATTVAKREQEIARMASAWRQEARHDRGLRLGARAMGGGQSAVCRPRAGGLVQQPFTGQPGPDVPREVAQPADKSYRVTPPAPAIAALKANPGLAD